MSEPAGSFGFGADKKKKKSMSLVFQIFGWTFLLNSIRMIIEGILSVKATVGIMSGPVLMEHMAVILGKAFLNWRTWVVVILGTFAIYYVIMKIIVFLNHFLPSFGSLSTGSVAQQELNHDT